MIHAFNFDGRNFVLDVFSSSLLEVDESTFEVLKLYEDKVSASTIHERLDARFGIETIDEIIEEVDTLIAQGILDTQIDYCEVEPKHDGHVKAICLHIAHDCNLRCKYCFAHTGAIGGKRCLMSAEVGKKALDFLFENSGSIHNLEVDFFGGEPMMNFDVVKEIIEYGEVLKQKYGKNINYTMTTNGYELADEDIEYLNDKMYNIVISLDGRPEKHNFMRPCVGGAGSHESILKTAKKMVKLRGDKSHYIRGTFTRHNLDFMEDVKYMQSQGFKQISIEPVVADEKTSYSLNESHLDDICAEYERLAKWYIKERAEDRWFSFFHFFIDLKKGPCMTKRLSGCGAGCEYLAVTPDGDIYPCHQFTSFEDFKLGTLDTGIVNADKRKMFEKNQVSAKEDCRNCFAQMWCGGGCAANAHSFNGDIGKPHELECIMQRKRIECALAIYAIEKENAAK